MKQLIKNYTFSSSAKTITLSDFATNGLVLERLQLIVDTTTNNILYNFADSTIATASIGGTGNEVITLSTVGTASSSDKLMIIYDCQTNDPTYDSTASATVEGTTSDTAVVTDANGTISGKLRGLVKIFADIWDSVNHRFAVNPAPLSSTIDSITTIASITRPVTPTLTQVASSASSVTILAANTSRKLATIYNDSTAILYLALNGSTAASTTVYTLQIAPGGYYELPQSATDGVYDGQITGIWASANGYARITEIV